MTKIDGRLERVGKVSAFGCKMTDNHVKACLKTQTNMHPNIKLAMQQELDYRNKLGLVLEN